MFAQLIKIIRSFINLYVHIVKSLGEKRRNYFHSYETKVSIRRVTSNVEQKRIQTSFIIPLKSDKINNFSNILPLSYQITKAEYIYIREFILNNTNYLKNSKFDNSSNNLSRIPLTTKDYAF